MGMCGMGFIPVQPGGINSAPQSEWHGTHAVELQDQSRATKEAIACNPKTKTIEII
jgi:hypothetical protein